MHLGKHILLVDDDVNRRRQLAFVLKLGGFEVLALRSPMEALNWLAISRCSGEPCDLVLLIGFSTLQDDRKVFEELKKTASRVPLVMVDRDAESGKQIVWKKDGDEQPPIFLSRPQLIADIVRNFFCRRSGEAS